MRAAGLAGLLAGGGNGVLVMERAGRRRGELVNGRHLRLLEAMVRLGLSKVWGQGLVAYVLVSSDRGVG